MTWPETLRNLVDSRALGKCEYCLLDEEDAGFPHQLDHVVSRKHGGLSSLENLAFLVISAIDTKPSDIRSLNHKTGALIRLFHPRHDPWTEPFAIFGSRIEPLTEVGLVTTQLLRLNFPARVTERRLLQSLGRYPHARDK